MRAGKLDRTITIERRTETLNDLGVPQEAWTPATTVRAELVEQSADELARAFGEASEIKTTFRTRYVEGVTSADRVLYAGEAYELSSVTEIGRRRGLELRTKARGA